MPHPQQSDSLSLEQELFTLLSDQKSRNKALVSVNEELSETINKQEGMITELRRKNRALEKNKERLEGTIGALNMSTLKLENIVDRLKDERDVLEEERREIEEGHERQRYWSNQHRVESLEEELKAAYERTAELERMLDARDADIDELEERMLRETGEGRE